MYSLEHHKKAYSLKCRVRFFGILFYIIFSTPVYFSVRKINTLPKNFLTLYIPIICTKKIDIIRIPAAYVDNYISSKTCFIYFFDENNFLRFLHLVSYKQLILLPNEIVLLHATALKNVIPYPVHIYHHANLKYTFQYVYID